MVDVTEYEAAEPGDEGFTDAELTELALASEIDQPVDADAVPLAVYLSQAPSPLPQWYMPAVMVRSGGGRWRTPVVLTIVFAFVLLEALGLM